MARKVENGFRDDTLAAAPPRRSALGFFRHMLERCVDVVELRLNGFLALLQLLFQARFLFPG